MPVTAEQMAALRAYLEGDFLLFRRLNNELDRSKALGWSMLLNAAFFNAVDRRFAEHGTNADVVKFVGEVRARAPQLGDELDPRAAERMIRAVLTTDEVIDEMDSATSVRTQLFLLYPLVEDEQLDEAGLDAFMAETRKLADEWLE